MIRKEAWPFYRTISGVRLCWELEVPKGPKGFQKAEIQGCIDTKITSIHTHHRGATHQQFRRVSNPARKIEQLCKSHQARKHECTLNRCVAFRDDCYDSWCKVAPPRDSTALYRDTPRETGGAVSSEIPGVFAPLSPSGRAWQISVSLRHHYIPSPGIRKLFSRVASTNQTLSWNQFLPNQLFLLPEEGEHVGARRLWPYVDLSAPRHGEHYAHTHPCNAPPPKILGS